MSTTPEPEDDELALQPWEDTLDEDEDDELALQPWEDTLDEQPKGQA